MVYFTPVVTTLVAVSIMWKFIYHPRFGLLNYVLGFFGITPVDWLGNPDFAMPAIILMAVWKNFGYNMIIFIADRKSTRLNSSHANISYAVFCLKKKTKNK